ncbi:MAG: arginine--tRNA ligase [Verrucomicrobia bacterium GWF2_51_19]|nr:MAG: arginine--tRNA ligase [Verrucomicrobia bacterium GWF2_51_19]HBA82840.1 arginine--tRNA ligase [Verrucomicrobiota bacterium]
MSAHFFVESALTQLIERAARATGLFDESFSADIRPADPRFGDFQANGVLPFAKRNKQNPRALAETLASKLQSEPTLDGLAVISVAGPGFINFSLTPRFLLSWLKNFASETSFQSSAKHFLEGKRISIDYSSPNTAKQMHVGHLRSMIIGESIQRILRFCGASVHRDNHIGDWGTQFGILLFAIKKNQVDLATLQEPLEELEKLYKEGYALTKTSEEALNGARSELVKLQQGDAENLHLWQQINAVSYRAFDEIYAEMDIAFDNVWGESFYRDKVDRVYNELHECGVSEESDGAQVVFHRDVEQFKDQPFLIRKSDGASNYASTDLATVLFKVLECGFGEIVYVTDGRQQDHFQQLFLTVKKWFAKKHYPMPELHHVWFGTILGEDGKAIKTRSGDPIRLKELIREAIARAYSIVEEKNPDLAESDKQHIAKAVGLGALRYADLVQNRTNDYVFAWDKLLSFDGNTAPYLLYAVARIHAIFRKAQLPLFDLDNSASAFETPEELALAKKLVAFPFALKQAIDELRPHFICHYLFELSSLFSSFYNANRVLVDETDVKARRFLLCSRTLATLETGLHLLGIKTLHLM